MKRILVRRSFDDDLAISRITIVLRTHTEMRTSSTIPYGTSWYFSVISRSYGLSLPLKNILVLFFATLVTKFASKNDENVNPLPYMDYKLLYPDEDYRKRTGSSDNRAPGNIKEGY